MADGGEEEGQENPFSFKTFVSKKDKRSLPSSEDDERNSEDEIIMNLPDIGLEPRGERSRKKQLVVSDDENQSHKKTDDNPFSFKKFLQKSNGSVSGGARPKVMEMRCADGLAGGLATLDLASDLPDFVQDHFSGDHSLRRPRPVPDVPLPDFALDSNVRNNTNHDLPLSSPDVEPNDLINSLPTGEGARPKHNRNHSLGRGDNFPVPSHQRNGHLHSDNSVEKDVLLANCTGGLPDFLSDSAVNRDRVVTVDDNIPNGHGEEVHDELRQLREENRELRRKLDEARRFADRESKRVADMVVEMAAIEKREAEDTAALENMVQQVEANLAATTKRAVAAESTVSKLKQEVKSLQNQLTASRLENEALMSGKGGMEIVRTKAKYASEQLTMAANTAEQRLKELMSGVETLKLVSDVLASIDKITEDGATGQTESDNVEEAGGACGGTSPT